MAQPSGFPSRKRRYRRYAKQSVEKELPKIFFCGDPHGEFAHINEAAIEHRPEAMVILGDLQPPDDLDVVLAPALEVTEIWWIPGNHDTDTEEIYDRLWRNGLVEHNIHGKVVTIAGIKIAGLGGVFRGQIWMPDGEPNYRSAASFVRRSGRSNLWRGGLPRRHRSSIFPSVYDNLASQKADVLVTHEAAGCHKKGFDAIDRLGKALHVKWIFHGHQHEDRDFGMYKGMHVRAVGYRGIVDLQGNDIVEAQIDPRDLLIMQQACDEPAPEVFDTIYSQPVVDFHSYRSPNPYRTDREGNRSKRNWNRSQRQDKERECRRLNEAKNQTIQDVAPKKDKCL